MGYKILCVDVCAPKVLEIHSGFPFLSLSPAHTHPTPPPQWTISLCGLVGLPFPFSLAIPFLEKQKWKEIQRVFSLVFPRGELDFFSGVFPALLFFLLKGCLHPAWIHRERESQQKDWIPRRNILAILQLIWWRGLRKMSGLGCSWRIELQVVHGEQTTFKRRSLISARRRRKTSPSTLKPPENLGASGVH